MDEMFEMGRVQGEFHTVQTVMRFCAANPNATAEQIRKTLESALKAPPGKLQEAIGQTTRAA